MVHFSYIDFLSSRKVATCLFVLFIFLAILGVEIPQENYTSAEEVQNWLVEHHLIAEYAGQLGLTRIYSGFVFIMTVLLLCASTLFCSYKRIRACLEKKKVNQSLVVFPIENNVTFSVQGHTAGQFISSAKDFLRRKKYQVRSFQHNGIIAERGKYGFWGSILFHLSFVVIIAGALISIWTRFEGVVLLTEGQTFTGKPDEYAKIVRSPALSIPEFDFLINFRKYMPSTQPQTQSSINELQFIDPLHNFNAVKQVRAFHAISHRGFTFYQQDHGYSPRFIVKDVKGNKLFDAFVALRTTNVRDDFIFDDYFVVQHGGMKIHANLYPDAIEQEGKFVKTSSKPLNPIVDITSFLDKKVVGKTTIRLGDMAKISDFQISFEELRYWASFEVVRDPGVVIIYAGFFLGISGLLIRLFYAQENIWITIRKKTTGLTITIVGKAERSQALFAENIESLVQKIKES